MKLPYGWLMLSVRTEAEIVRKGFIGRMRCKHPEKTNFAMIDYRGGPGSFSDTYKGTVCISCGHILDKKRTY